MSAKEIRKDPFIKSIFDEGGTEQPSGNFTNQIINTIKAQSKKSAFVYKPVISKKAWLVIASGKPRGNRLRGFLLCRPAFGAVFFARVHYGAADGFCWLLGRSFL